MESNPANPVIATKASASSYTVIALPMESSVTTVTVQTASTTCLMKRRDRRQ